MRVPARLVATTLPLLAACYRYTPVTTDVVPANAHVRFTLAEPVASSLVTVLGQETIAVAGRVHSASDSLYMLSASETTKRAIGPYPPRRIVWAGEIVRIPRLAVASVEVRSLDKKRTTRAAVIGAVAGVLAARVIVAVVGSSGGGGDDGGGVIPP